jgi:hypothetical protein
VKHEFEKKIGSLSAAELSTLASLPLFETEQGHFVAVRGLRNPRTVPPDLPGLMLGAGQQQEDEGEGEGQHSSDQRGGISLGGDLVVFTRKPTMEAAYAALGITPLLEVRFEFLLNILKLFFCLGLFFPSFFYLKWAAFDISIA